MGLPLNDLLGRVTSRQINLYRTSYRVDPPYGQLVIYMLAQFMAIFWNVNRTKRTAAKSRNDFLPKEWQIEPVDVTGKVRGYVDPPDLNKRTREQANSLWAKIKKGFGFGD